MGPVRIGLELVAEGFTAPTALAPAGDGSGRLFVADQNGLIWIVTPDRGRQPNPFLDIRDRMVSLRSGYDERGLLGLALHPQFAQNGRFYVYYSAPRRPGAPAGWDHTGVLAEFRVSANDPNRADPASERLVLQIDQPQGNHNGGGLAFGPDGFLYLGLGDGGAANDRGTGHPPMGNGQDTSTLLGAMLRLDVSEGRDGQPYAIPQDNPFVDGGGRAELFAYGFRNPYRFSFDSGGAGELFVADVGQNLWEEINVVRAGGNYGWNLKEGAHCFDPDAPSNPPASCPDTSSTGVLLQDPIIEYDHSMGAAIIGGYVYRGTALPQLTGRYVFADWAANGRLFVASRPETGSGYILPDGGGPHQSKYDLYPETEGTLWPFEVVEPDPNPFTFVLAFGRDVEGELYILTTESQGPSGQSGRLYTLVPAS